MGGTGPFYKTRLVFALFLSISRVGANLLVVLLEGGKIFTSLGEFAFFHTLTDVPVHKSTLRVHEIKLVVETTPSSRDGSGIRKHAKTARSLGEVTTRNAGRGLIADTELETSRAPIDELDGALGLDAGDGSLYVCGDDVTAVEQAASHVFAVLGVALHHLIAILEAREGHLRHRVLLVVGLIRREEWSVGSKREVDTREWHEISLELVKIDIERAIEAQ
jgi:hypothetical protein